MNEKRKSSRIHLVYYLLVFDRDTERLIGHLADISTGGMRLLMRQPVESGRTYHMRMLLPTGPDEGSREIALDARTMWTKSNMVSDFYGAGFEFKGLTENEVSTLRNLIGQCGRIEITKKGRKGPVR
jgi:c-di-GMP-binding flagellar brake protein YcgR